MIHQDYLMRAIEMFVAALMKILKLKQEDYEEALEEINLLSRKVLGLSAKSLNTLSETEILSLLSKEGQPDVDRSIIAAVLLKEEAEIYHRLLDTQQSYPRCIKALNLLLRTLLTGYEVHLPRQYTEPDEILTSLAEYELPTESILLLMSYYETKGMYAKAEDQLYILWEKDREDPALAERGIAFYRRLLEKDDDTLSAGNLPRDEVSEGLTRFLEQYRIG